MPQRKERQAGRDIFDPNMFGSVEEVFEVHPGAKVLYHIWYEFESSSRSPEAAASRKNRLNEWSLSISSRVERFLEASVPKKAFLEGEYKEIGWGAFIRETAQKDADVELTKRKMALKLPSEWPRAVSHGDKVHLRRLKAQKRQGTRPSDIH